MPERLLICFLASIAALLPLTAQERILPRFGPNNVTSNNITIEQGDSHLLHRAPIEYPREALAKRIEGPVVLELDLNENGLVSDARVISGPQELRRAALQSVLQWHYSKEIALPGKVQVTINFKLPEMSQAVPAAIIPRPEFAQPAGTVTIKSVEITGLLDSARDALRSRLPVHEGDTLSPEAIQKLRQAILDTDEHLSFNIRGGPDGAMLQIFLRDEPMGVTSGAAAPVPTRIRVGGQVQASKLVAQPPPVYPPLAKRARIQGAVRLNAIIGQDGTVQNLSVVSGHPLLIPAALEAVKNWTYQPTLLNGQPVEVITQIDVNFTLNDAPQQSR